MEKSQDKKLFSNTNWNLYRCFVILYEAGSYSNAEKLINIARNNIRANIGTLENQIGKTLFISHRSGVTPTNEANTLYPLIKQAISTLIEAEESVKDFDKNTKAVIHIGIPATTAGIVLVKFFANFTKEYPNIKLEFYDRSHRDTIDLLVQRKIDFVIDMEYNCKKNGFETIDLFNFWYSFVASKDFLKANGISDEITIKQLIKLPIVAPRSYLQSLCNETGINIQPTITAPTTESVLPHIKNGAYIGYYVYGLIERLGENNLVNVKIKDVNYQKIKLVLGYDKSRLSQASKIFIESILQFLKQEPFGDSLV